MKQIVLLLLFVSSSFGLFAQHSHEENVANKNITPFNDAAEAKAGITSVHLNAHPNWKSFTNKYPGWGARFSNYTQLPHRAFGLPITFAPGGNDPVAKAKAFLTQELAAYQIPVQDLILTRSKNDGKFIHVDFKQKHQGVEVLWSRVGVRFTQDLRIALFMVDAHKNIPNLSASISPATAILKQNKQSPHQ